MVSESDRYSDEQYQACYEALNAQRWKYRAVAEGPYRMIAALQGPAEARRIITEEWSKRAADSAPPGNTPSLRAAMRAAADAMFNEILDELEAEYGRSEEPTDRGG